MTTRDNRFLDPDELVKRYGDVLRKRSTVELDAEEWEAACSRAEQSEWGVGALVTHKNRVLLVRERRWEDEERWVSPGGMLETDETHEEGAVREIREETGIEVEIGGLAAIREKTYVHEDDSRRFDFRFAMFDATPRTMELATDPGLDGGDIRAVEWFETLPENTYERDLLVRIRDQRTKA